MAQFVPLKIDTEGPEWQTWARKYRHEGNGIPILYVVRANGELAYARSGSKTGDDLPRFLIEHLSTAGVIFSDAQLTALKSAVDEAKAAVEAGDQATAVRRLDSVRKLGTLGKLGSHSTIAKEADSLYEQLLDAGSKALALAQEQLAGDERFVGMVGVLSANRIYGRLPELKKELGAAQRDLSKNPDFRDDLKLAETLDKALSNLGQKNGSKQATAGLEIIVSKHPGTPAAKLASEKLRELGREPGEPETKPTPNSGERRVWKAAQGNFQVEATFVAVRERQVELRRVDGKIITVDLERLSEADRDYVAKQPSSR